MRDVPPRQGPMVLRRVLADLLEQYRGAGGTLVPATALVEYTLNGYVLIPA